MMDFMNELTLNHWTWFVIALVLLVLEIALPGVVFLWMAMASVIVGGVVFFAPDLGWEGQLIIFAVLSIISVYVGRTFLRRNPIETDDQNLNQRGRSFVGQTYRLISDMDNGRGKVRIGDTNWTVEGDFDGLAGDKVKVVDVDVTYLIVEPV
tara:strand:- start:3406 stop:3861 length:456 start_codon:yes stop_codon:yes gene_type:complete